MFMPQTVSGLTIQVDWLCRLRHYHQRFMIMPIIFNGMIIEVEWLCRRQSTALPAKLNGYAEDVEWLYH
jgi:hypothetical protein